MAVKIYTCLKCGTVWGSVAAGYPKQCKSCKRKDWDGLHASTGRLLAGAAVPGVTVPAVTGVPCTCRLCGGSWVSRSAETVPVQCPKCKKTKWREVAADGFDPGGLLEQGRCECTKCGNVWFHRGAELPKRCPVCRYNRWCKAIIDKSIYDANNPVRYDCARKWFYLQGRLQGDPVTGVHQYVDNPVGVCYICGWGNKTGVQIGIIPKPITPEEGAKRRAAWEAAHPGEKF